METIMYNPNEDEQNLSADDKDNGGNGNPGDIDIYPTYPTSGHDHPSHSQGGGGYPVSGHDYPGMW